MIEADLIASITSSFTPVVLGRGKRLFPDGVEKELRLTSANPTSTGVTVLTLEPVRPDPSTNS